MSRHSCFVLGGLFPYSLLSNSSRAKSGTFTSQDGDARVFCLCGISKVKERRCFEFKEKLGESTRENSFTCIRSGNCSKLLKAIIVA